MLEILVNNTPILKLIDHFRENPMNTRMERENMCIPYNKSIHFTYRTVAVMVNGLCWSDFGV